MTPCEIAKNFEEITPRRHTPHISTNRLNDHACNFFPVPMRVELFNQCRGIIEREHCRQCGERCRNSGTIRQSERCDAGTGLNEQAVAVTMVAAIEFHNAIATRKSTRQTDRTQRRFSPGIDKPDLLNRGNEPRDQFRDFNLAFRWRAERCSDFKDLTQGLDDFWRTMPEDQRPPRTDIIDVFLPVGIPHVRTAATLDEERLAVNRAERPNW